MQANWNVSYSIATPESIEDGDYAEYGMELEGGTFREAIEIFGSYSGGLEADSYPITKQCPPRWLTRFDDDSHRIDGEQKDLSLHIPAQISASSRLRLARLFRIPIFTPAAR